MKLSSKFVKRIVVTCIVSLISMFLLAGNRIKAGDTGWKTYMSSAFKDYVFTASYPPDWTPGRPLPDYDGFLIKDIPTNLSGITATGHVQIIWDTLDSPFNYPFATTVRPNEVPPEIVQALEAGTATSEQLDRIIPAEGCGQLGRKCVELGRTPFQISNHHGLLIEFAPEKLFDPRQNALADPVAPTGFRLYFGRDREHMALFVAFDVSLDSLPDNWASGEKLPGRYMYANTEIAGIYRELLPDVVRFLHSAEFRHFSELDDDSGLMTVYEGRIRTSQRRDFWAELYLKLTYPSEWQVKELDATPATAEQPIGRLVASVTGPEDPLSVGAPEKLYIVLEGVDAHGPAGFLATTEPLVDLFFKDYEKVGSEAVEVGSFGYLANIHTKFIVGTGKTYISDFVGNDANGRALKIRTYTAGGQTSVANFIFVADEADFDRVLPVVEEMVNAASFNLLNPILQ